MTLRQALEDVPEIRWLRSSGEEEELSSWGESPPSAEDADLVEGEHFGAVAVPRIDSTGFTHFLDGAQRSRRAFFYQWEPAYLAFINAGILERKKGEMIPEEEWYSERLCLFTADREELRLRLEGKGSWEYIGLSLNEDAGVGGMLEGIQTAVSTERDVMERELALRWLGEGSSREGWLLVDGGIASLSSHIEGFSQVVGVVKTHRRQFFRSRERAQVVGELRVGERTPVFEVRIGRWENRAYSWYLRLHQDPLESPLFGLVRVEMPADQETLRHVDLISAWLLNERYPLSLPDVRYDRLLYPIRRVEMYLRSRQPSDVALLGLIGI